MLLDITILTPKEIVLQKKAKSIILPGEAGVFEVLPFHKRLLTRLVSGTINVEEESIPIRRGIVKVNQNKVVAIIEGR